MQVQCYFRKVLSGIDFARVSIALGWGMHNISSEELREGGEVEQFLRECGLIETPHVFMATHSIGDRDWHVVEGHQPPFYEEESFNEGWYVLTDQSCTYLYCRSATSGSSLTAEKQKDDTWLVTLEVPVLKGEPYKGVYWECFHSALSLEND